MFPLVQDTLEELTIIYTKNSQIIFNGSLSSPCSFHTSSTPSNTTIWFNPKSIILYSLRPKMCQTTTIIYKYSNWYVKTQPKFTRLARGLVAVPVWSFPPTMAGGCDAIDVLAPSCVSTNNGTVRYKSWLQNLQFPYISFICFLRVRFCGILPSPELR